MQPLARDGFTAAEVRAALHAPNQVFKFQYDLLTSGNVYIKTLTNVIYGEVANNTFNRIKRTARFTLEDLGDINFLSDRIKPWVCIIIGSRWAKFPMGVFLLSTPPRSANAYGNVVREIAAYDQLQVLVDDKIVERYTVTAGTNYISAVSTLLTGAGLNLQNLTATDKVLAHDREWEPGTEKLAIANDLLGAINYKSLFADENGYMVAQPYVSPSVRASEYTYADRPVTDSTGTYESVLLPGVTEDFDLFAIPNRWLLTVSDPEVTPLTASYTNTNPDSPTSTVNRGRVIVEPREVEAVDQATLDAKVQRLALESTQRYRKVEFKTGLMPMHSDSDVITLNCSKLGINAKFSETEWVMPLKAGAPMTHRARRVESI